MTLPAVPSDGTLYDFKFDVGTRQWVLWTSTIEKLSIPAGVSFSDIIIPTKVIGKGGVYTHARVQARKWGRSTKKSPK